jgi:hypothetical protein
MWARRHDLSNLGSLQLEWVLLLMCAAIQSLAFPQPFHMMHAARGWRSLAASIFPHQGPHIALLQPTLLTLIPILSPPHTIRTERRRERLPFTHIAGPGACV